MVGAKATNALSEYFKVESHRDGKMAVAEFKEGALINYKETKTGNTITGTSIYFKPDATIFKEGITLEYEPLKKQIQELAYLSPGMVFTLQYEDKPEEVITSQRGILDYIEDLNKNKTCLTSVFYAEATEDRMGVKLAMVYNDTYSDSYKLYTNSIPNPEGGTHLTGFRTALTASINSYARENGIFKEKDVNLSGDELKEGLSLVLSFIMPDPVFEGQTKGKLTSSEGRVVVQRLVVKELKNWLTNNPRDAKAIINKALLARAAREKAKKAKETVRKQDSKRRTVLPGKLADASSKNRQECEVFLVEGDSAAGSTKEARNRTTQAVFPVRGRRRLAGLIEY